MSDNKKGNLSLRMDSKTKNFVTNDFLNKNLKKSTAIVNTPKRANNFLDNSSNKKIISLKQMTDKTSRSSKTKVLLQEKATLLPMSKNKISKNFLNNNLRLNFEKENDKGRSRKIKSFLSKPNRIKNVKSKYSAKGIVSTKSTFFSFKLLPIKKRKVQKSLTGVQLQKLVYKFKKQIMRDRFFSTFFRTFLTAPNIIEFLKKNAYYKPFFALPIYVRYFIAKRLVKLLSIYKIGMFIRVVLVCTLNNFFVTILRPFGYNKILYKISAGISFLKLRGSTKGTPFAAQIIGKVIGRFLMTRKFKRVVLVVKSKVNARIRSFMKGFTQYNVKVCGFVVRVAVTHNGCRYKKYARK